MASRKDEIVLHIVLICGLWFSFPFLLHNFHFSLKVADNKLSNWFILFHISLLFFKFSTFSVVLAPLIFRFTLFLIVARSVMQLLLLFKFFVS